jgi:cytochrome c oxidase subunit II
MTMKANAIRRMIVLAVPAALLARLAASQNETTVEMIAKRFVFIPNTITVPLGRPVAIRITAPEVAMGLSVPDFHVRTDVVPGREAVLRFTPDRSGSFTFVCDVFCGNGHEDMSGTLLVRG